ncbi:MAG: ubiquinone biosynthesis regulatory protein kinase UbiB [Gammaproteobacteria bacterium]|nr:ubiquinone biosynthesis regulatory protein kinase UbiB [Gammaproteobacteria bacterium]
MLKPRFFLRLLEINRVLARHHLDEIIVATHLFRPLRFLPRLWPGNWGRKRAREPRGARIRRALEELGPIFVKFGQALSTRRDLLPLDIADELALLQDRVPPFSGELALAIVEGAYHRPVDEVFGRFDMTPLAAASIAQVHKATLHDGHEVVVKVLRPGMDRIIRRDLEIMYALALLAERYWREGRRLHAVAVVREYERTILDELDLMREAANAAQLRRNFEDSPLLYVPEVHWDYCRPDAIVFERISGIPVSDIARLREHGTDMRQLAENGVQTFFKQVFEHNFFHADMHPGNVFVNVTDPANPQYIAVDFGIVGTLSQKDQHYLAENFLAFFNRDYHRVAKLHVDSGWVPPETRIDELESAIRTVCEPIFNKPLKDISFGQVLLRLFRTARRFNMEVQPQLVLLQKTLLNIEGLGRELYPDLDLWATAQPILERWVRQRVGGLAVLHRLREEWPDLSGSLQELPGIVQSLVRQAAEGSLRVEIATPAVDKLHEDLLDVVRQRFGAIAGGSIVIAGALLVSFDVEPIWLGWTLGGTGLAYLLIARARR